MALTHVPNHRRRAVLLALSLLVAGAASAQSLNWEGQTGVFITPLAYTAASPNDSIGKPIIAYHYLDAGDVLGSFHTASATVGLIGRIEFGYTRIFHQAADTPGLSPLWKGGFNIVHAKANLVKENSAGQKWLPAISAGFVARTQDPNVGGWLAGRNYNNPVLDLRDRSPVLDRALEVADETFDLFQFGTRKHANPFVLPYSPIGAGPSAPRRSS